MISKNFIKPGMLVKFHDGTLVIAGLEDDNTLNLFWNDKSGRVLRLKDYNGMLQYPKSPELDIDEIYSCGGIFEPFLMTTECRRLLWTRNKRIYSYEEIILVNKIWFLLSESKFSSINAISLDHRGTKSVWVTYGDRRVLAYSSVLFPNINIGEVIPLKEIIDKGREQKCNIV